MVNICFIYNLRWLTTGKSGDQTNFVSFSGTAELLFIKGENGVACMSLSSPHCLARSEILCFRCCVLGYRYEYFLISRRSVLCFVAKSALFAVCRLWYHARVTRVLTRQIWSCSWRCGGAEGRHLSNLVGAESRKWCRSLGGKW